MEEQNQLSGKQENPQDYILDESKDQMKEDIYLKEEKQEEDGAAAVRFSDGAIEPSAEQNYGEPDSYAQFNYGTVVPPPQQNYGNPVHPLQQNYGNPVHPLQQNYGNPVPPLQQNYGKPAPPLQQNYGNPVPPAKYGMPNQVVPPVNGYANRNEEISNGMAIASMVLGIVSIVLCWWFILALPCGIVGLVLGCVYRYKGGKSGMSVAGIVCGSIGIAFAIIEICVYIMSFGVMLYSY